MLRFSDLRVGGGGIVRILRWSNNMGVIDKLRDSVFSKSAKPHGNEWTWYRERHDAECRFRDQLGIRLHGA
jgi:hypothetical protein